jgi:hypothetical protein
MLSVITLRVVVLNVVMLCVVIQSGVMLNVVAPKLAPRSRKIIPHLKFKTTLHFPPHAIRCKSYQTLFLCR